MPDARSRAWNRPHKGQPAQARRPALRCPSLVLRGQALPGSGWCQRQDGREKFPRASVCRSWLLPRFAGRGEPSRAAPSRRAPRRPSAQRKRPRVPCRPPQIKFILLVSRQGKVRLAKWYQRVRPKDKLRIRREVTAMVLSRPGKLCNFLEWRDDKIVYRR